MFLSLFSFQGSRFVIFFTVVCCDNKHILSCLEWLVNTFFNLFKIVFQVVVTAYLNYQPRIFIIHSFKHLSTLYLKKIDFLFFLVFLPTFFLYKPLFNRIYKKPSFFLTIRIFLLISLCFSYYTHFCFYYPVNFPTKMQLF